MPPVARPVVTETRPLGLSPRKTRPPEEGVGRTAVVVGHPVAHLQAQAEVHLVGHAQSQADGCQRVWLGGADQALGELGGECILHTPLWNLQENTHPSFRPNTTSLDC